MVVCAVLLQPCCPYGRPREPLPRAHLKDHYPHAPLLPPVRVLFLKPLSALNDSLQWMFTRPRKTALSPDLTNCGPDVGNYYF